MATATRKRDLAGNPIFDEPKAGLRERLDPGTPEFDAYVAEDALKAPEGSAERVESESPQDEQASMGDSAVPITVTDYDANGEAIDAPVEPAPDVEPHLFAALRPPEMWDGKEVVAHVLKFAGNVPVSRGDDAHVGHWNGMRADRPVFYRIQAVPQGTSYDAAKRDGDIVGFNMVRKLRVVAWSLTDDSMALDEMAAELLEAQESRDHYGEEYGRAVRALATLRDSIDGFKAATLDRNSSVPWGEFDALCELANDMVSEFTPDVPEWGHQPKNDCCESCAAEEPEDGSWDLAGDEVLLCPACAAALAEEPSALDQALAEALDPDDLPYE